MSSNINEMLNNLMSNIDMVSETKKIIGDAMTMPDGTVIVPVSKISMGFGGGGSEFSTSAASDKNGSGGGIGGGVKVTPEAFLVINNGNVRLIPMGGGSSPLDKAIDMIPGIIDKVNSFFAGRINKDKGETE